LTRKERLVLALCVLPAIAVSAIESHVTPYLMSGSGQSSGAFFSGIGGRYAELGAASITDLGTWAPYYPTVLGGGGVEFSLSRGSFPLWKGPFAAVAGVEIGAWGGAVSGSTASGAAFASTQAGSFALSVRAAERFRFALWKGDVSIELGPFAAVNCLYFIKESISGINSAVSLPPNPADLVFAGAGLGLDYDLRFGPGLLRLGLRGDIALTPLASADGTLGDPIVFPWRALLLAGYDLPLGVHKGRI
jgi:hypothetical protein